MMQAKKSLNTIKGKQAEKTASKYLTKKLKYKIIAINYRTIMGEIDIIARHKKIIIFVEVKSKSSLYFGLPSEEVTPRKQNKIRNVALLFLKENNLQDACIRFDVIEVLNNNINHIINAF